MAWNPLRAPHPGSTKELTCSRHTPMSFGPGSVAEAAAQVKQCVLAEKTINAAIVDLGLGPRQPSGLGVIDLLDKVGVPAAVWTDWSEGARRLMFVYAAFSWYNPVGLLPKARFTAGTNADRVARDFARDITRIHRREALDPDISDYFRPRQDAAWPFGKVLSSRADLLKWKAFVTYSQTAAVAAQLRLSKKSIDNWLVEKYTPVWELLGHASEHMEIDDADIAEPLDLLKPEDQPEKRDGKKRPNQIARPRFTSSHAPSRGSSTTPWSALVIRSARPGTAKRHSARDR